MSKELEVIYVTEDDIESCGLWQEDTGTPFIRKSDYDELAKDMSAQATALYDLLTAKLAEAERLNKVALEAMRRLMLCDMAEVRTIKGSSGAIDNARNAIKEMEKP